MKIRNRKSAKAGDLPDSGRRTFTRRCSGIAAALLVEARPFNRALAANGRANGPDSGAAGRLRAFLEEFAATPVQETSLDLSAGAFQRRRGATAAKLERLRAIDRNAVEGDDLLNYRFAESLLAGELLAQGRMLWSMDPRVYLPFSELSQLIENPDASENDSAKALRLLKEELAAEIKNVGPEPGRMIEAHQDWVDKAKAHVLEKQLVPIPWKERVEVVPRAQFQRKNSYYGDFDQAKGPNSEGVWVGHWRINPYEEQWDEETKRQYLTEHDWGVIIDTAPHETYAGHHVQGLYQAHNPYKLRQKFGIAIFSEGWGLYNETLMYETGFFPSERIHLRQLQLRLWRIARVIWDVGLNTGKLGYEECVSLLADGVGFLRWAAELEVDGSATEPGYRIGYFSGASEILRMRAAVKALLGARFTLSDFHERLLKVGNMPPALMREGLMRSYQTSSRPPL